MRSGSSFQQFGADHNGRGSLGITGDFGDRSGEFSASTISHPLARRFFECEGYELRRALSPIVGIHPGFAPYIDLFSFRAAHPDTSALLLEQRDLPEIRAHLEQAQLSLKDWPASAPNQEFDESRNPDRAKLISLLRASNLARLEGEMSAAAPILTALSDQLLARLESTDPAQLTERALASATSEAARDRFYAAAIPKEYRHLIGLELRLVTGLIIECSRWQSFVCQCYRDPAVGIDPNSRMTVRFSEPLGVESVRARDLVEKILANAPTLHQWHDFSKRLNGYYDARTARIDRAAR